MRKHAHHLLTASLCVLAASAAGAQTASTGAEFLYVPNANQNGINQSFAAYRINPSTGFLSAVPGQPFKFNTGAAPVSCYCSVVPLADPQGRFLFYDFSWIPNSGYGSMRVNASTGALTNDSVVLPPEQMVGSAISTDPTGRFIFGALGSNGGANNWIQSINVAPDGHLALAPGEPYAFPGSYTYGPPAANASYVYVPNYNTNYPQPSDLYGFTINRMNGALTQSSATNDGIEPTNQAITPDGKFLYSDQTYTGSNGANEVEIVGYKVNADGSLTQLDQAAQETPDFPAQGLTMSPNGKFLYHVAPGDLRVYDIDPGTGYLTLVVVYSNYNTSGGPLVIDPAVKYAYIPQVTYPSPSTVAYTLEGFTVDPETGRLSPIPADETPLAAFPQNMAIVRPQ